PREDREEQVERADVLMVGRHEPAGEKARLMVRVMMRVGILMGFQRKRVSGNSAHIFLVSASINSGPWRPDWWSAARRRRCRPEQLRRAPQRPPAHPALPWELPPWAFRPWMRSRR